MTSGLRMTAVEKSKKWKNIILTNLSMTMTCQWLMVIKLLRTYRKTLAAAAAYSILSSIAARVLPYCHDCFITPATLILLACLLSVRALKVMSLGGSPGLVVMGDESWSRGRGFESRHHILTFFTLICCKNWISRFTHS